MKKLLFLALMSLLWLSCGKEDFNPANPDVAEFVARVKNGSYHSFETGSRGEKLWLMMPRFTVDHIQLLLEFSKDTSHITEFPFNPVSSRIPYPDGRNYCILGECLLWTVEGIRNGSGYGSLDPYLVDTSYVESGYYRSLRGAEILLVREIYNQWWIHFKDSNWQNKNPLENSNYRWY